MVNTDEQGPKPPRAPYRSPLRDTQAAQTRVRVIEAAIELFATTGYLRTTMRDLAEAAGVSVETVYAQGSKQALLLAAVDEVLAGPHRDVPMLETAPVAQALEQPTALDVLHGFTAALADVAMRAAALLVAFEDAAAADARTAELWRQSEERRRQDYRRVVETVAGLAPLREGLDVDHATDGLWSTMTPRVAKTQIDLGWDRDRIAGWAAALATTVLLGPGREPA